MQILKKRERLILYLTLAVITFSLIFNFLVAPVLAKNNALNKDIGLTKTKLIRYFRLLSHKDNIQKQYHQLAYSSDLSASGKDPGVVMLQEIEGLAKQADIQITDVRPHGLSDLASYKEMVIEIKAEGDTDSYLKFIYSIENSLSLLRIKKCQLSAKADSPALQGTLSLSRLILPE